MRLIPPLARAIDWTPLCAVALTMTTVAAIASPDPGVLLLVLRMTAVLLGSAAAFALVDPIAASTAAVPVPRWIRQWLRCLLALAAAAAAWSPVFTVASTRSTAPLPLPGLAVEAATCVAVALTGSALAVRRLPGTAAALAGLLTQITLIACTLALPTALQPWPGVGDPHWTPAHQGWAVALPCVLALLARANTDPTGRRPTHHPPGTTGSAEGFSG
ncbi:hypothetical protein [Actinomadura rubrisoli]|uniref:ABC transporter n=1 Tax=Actinomadura rubrisoli TaxID=2530368 RepID=A0A4R5B4F3_9ACTN|nr:hypothetical protein [Actinomadura rubrisoli]TDD80115.1 hypothetical protein E1298_26465 [Actinomadura rubrisoli]